MEASKVVWLFLVENDVHSRGRLNACHISVNTYDQGTFFSGELELELELELSRNRAVGRFQECPSCACGETVLGVESEADLPNADKRSVDRAGFSHTGNLVRPGFVGDTRSRCSPAAVAPNLC